MSLRVRALLVLGGIEALTMLVLFGASMVYLHRAGLERAQQHAADALALIKSSVAESLFVVNHYSAAEVIDAAFREIPEISYLQLLGDDGQVIAEKRKGLDLTGRSIYLSGAIELGGVEFGTLHLHFSTQELSAMIQRQTLLLSGFALLGLAISASISWFALGRLTALLEAMADGLHGMDVTAPESLPVPPGQELGRLVSAYNHLIERLHPT